MKLLDAMNASPVGAAYRYAGIPRAGESVMSQVNIVLIDGARWKAFFALGEYAWSRRTMKTAKRFDDWRPAQTREYPALEAPDVVTQLGDVSCGEG